MFSINKREELYNELKRELKVELDRLMLEEIKKPIQYRIPFNKLYNKVMARKQFLLYYNKNR